MARKPSDYANRLGLGITVGQKWGENHPNYKTNFCTLTDFIALHTQFEQKLKIATEAKLDKKGNTVILKEINADITKNVGYLKNLLKTEYSREKANEMYVIYGLVANKQGVYNFALDNDTRSRQLDTLVTKLSEANNPIATQKYGLSFWQDLVTRHRNEWQIAKSLLANRALAVKELQELYKKSGEWQSKLYRQIGIDFGSDEVDQVRRSFGFVSEAYK